VTELPSGTLTFLFTDLEGSTALWEHDADTMRVAVARHDELLTEVVHGGGGRVVKTTGDAKRDMTSHDRVSGTRRVLHVHSCLLRAVSFQLAS
jgi:class 3 adenylate cyclase